ncbi:hypothetical protein JCM21714_1364 [Gracilibacillus boraciitolerans JCM 21714]|uniref:Uncharacterized protein n=1 Tax=Gracilibacillus boraciitolerans JCM 21714 TaxID=1298598 RepID=W4VGM6_9BACI|nr:hypothetical protein [Gracilibacillus boraciitolerans]GAE92372.1 hypothetical protein JCM21714_1364 [Gracilibacillus boraciitolerans JCM 21714]
MASTEKLRKFVMDTKFNKFITTIIIFNAILIGLETYPAIYQQFYTYFVVIDLIILAIFTIEVVLKIIVLKIFLQMVGIYLILS